MHNKLKLLNIKKRKADYKSADDQSRQFFPRRNIHGEGCCTYAKGLQPLSMLFIIPTNKAFRCSSLKPHLLPSAPV